MHPDFDFSASQPRNIASGREDADILLDIHPNPTDGKLELNSNVAIYEYSLYDSYGRLQFKEFVKGVKTYTLDMDNQTEGIYFLQVKCGSEIITKKLVII